MPPKDQSVVPSATAIANARKAVMERLNQQSYLSQGFCLINPDMEAEAWRSFKERMRGAFLNPTSKESQQDFDILEIMQTKAGLARYLDTDIGEKFIKGEVLTHKEQMQIQNAKFKRKQLFIYFERFKKAQSQLIDYSQAISISCNGELSCPPGAFGGVKSFTGALDKITKRERTSDLGDLKDVARMTIKFEHMNDLVMAKSLIMLTKEFDAVRYSQKALKDRYGTCTGDDERYNVSSEGYQDIKFFLRMPCEMIGELQLNTKNMLVAKHEEHLIYDLTRQAPKDYTGKTPYSINNKDALTKVANNMNERWFQFVKTKTASARAFVPIIEKMIVRLKANIANDNFSLTITAEEHEALKRVALAIYDEVGRGMGVGKGRKVSSSSIWMKIKSTFWS